MGYFGGHRTCKITTSETSNAWLLDSIGEIHELLNILRSSVPLPEEVYNPDNLPVIGIIRNLYEPGSPLYQFEKIDHLLHSFTKEVESNEIFSIPGERAERETKQRAYIEACEKEAEDYAAAQKRKVETE